MEVSSDCWNYFPFVSAIVLRKLLLLQGKVTGNHGLQRKDCNSLKMFSSCVAESLWKQWWRAASGKVSGDFTEYFAVASGITLELYNVSRCWFEECLWNCGKYFLCVFCEVLATADRTLRVYYISRCSRTVSLHEMSFFINVRIWKYCLIRTLIENEVSDATLQLKFDTSLICVTESKTNAHWKNTIEIDRQTFT